jgi:antitoxin PrlF
MRIISKGQVTIPQAIREELGLLPQTEVEFHIVGDGVRMRKARRFRSTDELMQLLRGQD